MAHLDFAHNFSRNVSMAKLLSGLACFKWFVEGKFLSWQGDRSQMNGRSPKDNQYDTLY
jgi:hypothetical protein